MDEHRETSLLPEEREPVPSPEERERRRRAARRARKLRRGRRNWRIFLIVYSLLFLLAGALLCSLLYDYAGIYEATIPEDVMDEFMASSTDDTWRDCILKDLNFSVSDFEDARALFEEYYNAAIRGRDISYRKSAGEYSASSPVYTVRCNGMDLCAVTLTPIKEAGFRRYYWQVGELRSRFNFDRLESVCVEIDVPQGDGVWINGIPVSGAYLTGEAAPAPDVTPLERRFDRQPVFDRYRVERMYGSITVTDQNGRALSPIQEEDGVVRYVGREDTFYSFTVRAPENVVITVNGAVLSPSEAAGADSGVLAGLDAYTGGQAYQTLTYSFDGLYAQPEITARGPGGEVLTPLLNQKGELIYFPPQDDALAEQVSGVVKTFFDNYISYSGQAFSNARQQALLACILKGTELYSYVRDSRDAMIWASATEVRYDELSFADFSPVGEDCFTCTIRYKADFDATAWHERYSYDLQNAYELSFVRVNGAWYAAAMSVVAG